MESLNIGHVRKVFGFKGKQTFTTQYDIYNLIVHMHKSLYGDDIARVDKERSYRKRVGTGQKSFNLYQLNKELIQNHYDLIMKRRTGNREMNDGVLKILGISRDEDPYSDL